MTDKSLGDYLIVTVYRIIMVRCVFNDFLAVAFSSCSEWEHSSVHR
jgi:hypothetical protein